MITVFNIISRNIYELRLQWKLAIATRQQTSNNPRVPYVTQAFIEKRMWSRFLWMPVCYYILMTFGRFRHIIQFLGCTWRHHFLKSLPKDHQSYCLYQAWEGINLCLSKTFSAQEHASCKNRDILNFRVMAVRDIKLWTFLSKNIYLLRDI